MNVKYRGSLIYDSYIREMHGMPRAVMATVAPVSIHDPVNLPPCSQRNHARSANSMTMKNMQIDLGVSFVQGTRHKPHTVTVPNRFLHLQNCLNWLML